MQLAITVGASCSLIPEKPLDVCRESKDAHARDENTFNICQPNHQFKAENDTMYKLNKLQFYCFDKKSHIQICGLHGASVKLSLVCLSHLCHH